MDTLGNLLKKGFKSTSLQQTSYIMSEVDNTLKHLIPIDVEYQITVKEEQNNLTIGITSHHPTLNSWLKTEIETITKTVQAHLANKHIIPLEKAIIIAL